jgi:tetratricopeptide (TPR) repeat protein
MNSDDILKQANLHFRRGRYDEAIASFEELIEVSGEASEPGAHAQTVRGFLGKGFVLGQVGRYDEAIASYDEGIARDRDTTDPFLQEQVARALLHRDYLLSQASRLRDAIASYEEAIEIVEKVIAAASTLDELPLRAAIGRALIDKAFLLSKTGDWQRAIGT